MNENIIIQKIGFNGIKIVANLETIFLVLKYISESFKM